MKNYFIGFRGATGFWVVAADSRKQAFERFCGHHNLSGSTYCVAYRKQPPMGEYKGTVGPFFINLAA